MQTLSDETISALYGFGLASLVYFAVVVRLLAERRRAESRATEAEAGEKLALFRLDRCLDGERAANEYAFRLLDEPRFHEREVEAARLLGCSQVGDFGFLGKTRGACAGAPEREGRSR